MGIPDLGSSVPFDADAFISGHLDKGAKVEPNKNIPFVVGNRTIYIQETLVDPHIAISSEDDDLSRTILKVMETIGTDTPTIHDVVNSVHSLFPPGREDVMRVMKDIRSGENALFLGKYFVQTRDGSGNKVPYSAVCIHKALLAQAVASMYGLEVEMVEFGFESQVRDGVKESNRGMHAVLRTIDESVVYIADPNKTSKTGGSVYEKEEEYWKRFCGVEVGFVPSVYTIHGRTIFTPHSEVEVLV